MRHGGNMDFRTGHGLQALGDTPGDFGRDLLSNLYYQRGTTLESASAQDAYHSLALTVRDRLVDRHTRTAAAHYRGQSALRLLPVGRVPARPAARPEPALLGHRELRAPRRSTASGCPAPSSTPSTSSPAWATAAWAGSRPACWTRWRPWTSRRSATASATTSASSSRPSRTARQVERPDDWAFYGNPWEFPALRRPADGRLLRPHRARRRRHRAAPAAGCRARSCWASPATCWCPGTAPRRSTSSGCGSARASRESFDLSRFGAGQYAEAVAGRSSARRTSARCSTPTTAPSSAASCASSSSTSWYPARCGTSSGGSGSATASWDDFAAKVRRSSSTTPTRCWRSPS